MDSQLTSTSKLVLAASPAGPFSIEDAEAELVFGFDGMLALIPQFQVSSTVAAEYLAHAIAAEPSNLLCHTQRIYFFFTTVDNDGLYSALLDLFIALGGRGGALRKRLLSGSKSHLSSEQFRTLSRWLVQGAVAEKDRPPATQSILSLGITGTRKLVQVYYAESETQRDPLIEAREYIEYFQIDEARDLLEAAIFMQPDREELHIELIHLYQATRDNAGLQAMREKLSQTMPRLPECWLALGETDPSEGGYAS
jgi:hypothetical protein